jgi:signal transduction histidine kinase/ActR/RegA family two-component response regulator
MEEVNRVFAEGSALTEGRFETKDGRLITFELSGTLSEDEHGEPVLCGIGRNINERKQFEAKLSLAMAEAEAANRAKSEFLANMSHEIRTPMAAILGFADVLLEHPDSSEAQDAAITIKRNGEHLLEIINDILDLSKIEAGRLRIERIPCSPCRVVADVAAMMQHRASAKDLRLAVEYQTPLPRMITCDALRLRQILTNLVGNAIKFTELGTVRIVVRLVEEGRTSSLEIDVIDTGIGIPPERLDRLFDPFLQADMSTTRTFGGTGLGLTISRRLAQMLHGDIRVESELGNGSTFTLSLRLGNLLGAPMFTSPDEIDDVQHGEEEDEDAHVENLNLRVLLAEDSPDNQRLIAFVLQKAGADVTIVENGVLAVAALETAARRKNPFDLVLMDMQMPVMDGYQATREIRARDYPLPVIALTADAMEGQRQKCLAAGCSDYLTKPIDRRKLLKALANHARIMF